MVNFRPLLVPIGNPSLGDVVGRYLYLHLVARKDPDVVHPYLARYMRKNLKAVFKLHLELRIGKCIHDNTFNLDRFFFRQKYTPLNSIVVHEPSGHDLFA